MNWEEPFAIKPPEMAAFPPFVHYSGDNAFLTPEQCDEIVALAEKEPLGFGTIGNGGNDTFREDTGYRTARIRGLWRGSDELEWLFERARERVTWTNDAHYRFALSGFNEGMQYLRYDEAEDETPAGHYNWHQDFGGGYSSHRKLSIVINLSDPSEYEGCRLQLFSEGVFEQPYIGKGDALIFPSWLPHQVTPLTKGTRRAIACWVSGPQFQ